MKPLLTICEAKAKSEAQVEHRIVLGCVRASFEVSTGFVDDRRRLSLDLKLDKKFVGRKKEGVSGLPMGLEGVESVGEELNEGTVSLGGLP